MNTVGDNMHWVPPCICAKGACCAWIRRAAACHEPFAYKTDSTGGRGEPMHVNESLSMHGFGDTG